MFSQKNIPRLIVFTPICTIVISAVIILYTLISMQKNYLNEEVEKIEKEYLINQKKVLQNELDYIYEYIVYHKKVAADNIKKALNIQINSFYELLEKSDFNEKEYLNFIKQHSNENSDFVIYDMNSEEFYKDMDVFFYKDELSSIKNEIILKKEVFKIKFKSNLYYFRYFKKKNLIIAIKRDIYYDIDSLKETIARWSEYLRFGDDNYFIIYKNTNILLAHPYRKDFIGKDDTNLKDGKGDLFVQGFIKKAIKNPEGTFVEYYWNKPNKKEKIKKLTFVKLYKEWNWVLGAGVYFDDVQEVIEKKKKDLEKRIFDYIRTTVVISLLLILFVSYFAVEVSSKINSTIKKYQEKLKSKEEKLRNLNKDLNKKVQIAVKEAKEKDRAMLHQSRLARMGTLINMISHQWRQPLSQLSGIIMELETAIEFKKAKKKYILSSLSEATNTIEHMSLTIEDFKNFFKPEKEKEEFLVSSACKNSIALIRDTYINENIDLIFEINKDKKIKGYKREYSQVVLNLLINAKDQLLEKNIENKKVCLIIDEQDNKSIVTVKDNARGIELENIQMVFEPYFSTKKSQGTGLGLYMSKMIIEKNMQGSLSVENYEDGAIFKIEV
ncbi:sensor histidine kinase [Arcobacter roscoffensis]|uniref:histidine kinase n=1 Tax=Arcobacter roscoffensis TaxID=2961520 RepID=A0ABY5E297_9BACT|nr:cache domain-containing protein [Arcobacter roscoffensis]UTJ06319.1 cache domain-containing protein [Arcobacter roscoffensis]